MREKNIIPNLEYALNKAMEGKVSEELKKLYNAPYREMVPWDKFPLWARPNMNCEMPNEG